MYIYTHIYIYISIYLIFVFALQWLFLIRNIVTVQTLLRLACYVKIRIPKKNVHELFVLERWRFVCQVKFCTLLTNLSIDETCVPSQPWCPPESRESPFVPKGLIYLWNQHCHVYIYVYIYIYMSRCLFNMCIYIHILYTYISIYIYLYIYVYVCRTIFFINVYINTFI